MILVGNGKVFTRDAKQPYFENGAVVIDGTKIKAVGTEQSLKAAYPDADFIDVHGGVIMPGFINTHEHIYSALARGLAIKGYAPKGFLEILDGMWWNIDRHLTLDGTYASAIATYIECIKNGVTTIFDHHASYGSITGSLEMIEKAAKKAGVRSCLCYEVSDRDGADKMREAVLENEAFIRHANDDGTGMIAGMFGMHASFTLSDETLAFCREHTPEGAGYHIHVAEGIEDLHDCLKNHGKRIIDRLMDEQILGEHTLLAHCIYVNAHEMDLIRETDTMVVHNPESNMGNACGCPPTMEMVHKGILTGLGTDGYTHDMTESYKVANILHKHFLCDPNAAWGEIPEMLFSGNAKITGRIFNLQTGILKEGAAADVIVTDYVPPTPLAADNLNSHILFGMSGRSVITTIANGRVLMQDRVLKTLDEEAELAHVREAAEALWKSINS